MSDSDNDTFDRIASSKYTSQADLSDDDSAFVRHKRPSADSDIEDLANEVSSIDTAKASKIQAEIKKWEAVRTKARGQNVDASRIAKVDKKIKELQTELYSLTVTPADDKEIRRLERDLEALESERLAITQKIDAKTSRLRQLKPHNKQDDWLNDPSQLGGRIVEGKFVENDEDGDDYTQLATMMAERRRAAKAAGQYNTDSGHVKIINPKPSRDQNFGF